MIRQQPLPPLVITACLVAGPLAAAEPAAQATAIRDGELVLFADAKSAPLRPLGLLDGLPVQMLNSAADGRRVAIAELPGDWALELGGGREHTVEALVLSGTLSFDDAQLGRYGYAFVPAGAPAIAVDSGPDGASLLLFVDPPRDGDGRVARIVDARTLDWRPATTATEQTGRRLALEVKDLRRVEATGQRTWLLRAGADFEIPWERHGDVEEGFLVAGDYTNGECVDGTPVVGEYLPGGYFYRPGGIIHSGPDSGTREGAVWLLRTPTRLTVEFVSGCAAR